MPIRCQVQQGSEQLRQDSEYRCCISAFLRLLRFCVCFIFSLFDIGNAIKSHPLRLLLISTPCLHFCSALHMRCHLHHGHHAMDPKYRFSPNAIAPTQSPRAGESSLSAQSTSVSPASAPRLKRVSANASNNSSAGAVPNEELVCHAVFSLLLCHDAVRSSTKARFRLIDPMCSLGMCLASISSIKGEFVLPAVLTRPCQSHVSARNA